VSAQEWPKAYTLLDIQKTAHSTLIREAQRYEREAAAAGDDTAGVITRTVLTIVAQHLRERATDYWNEPASVAR
jgi:hypothetical protein